ncbi:MAG: alkaline phosphatase D family protein [Solirubrobacteraceae bacterium]
MGDGPIDRRTFLARSAITGGALTIGAGGAPTWASRRIHPEKVLREGAFRHGVAAGAPGQRSITLWTRVSDIERSGRVELEIARQADFRRVVARRQVRAAAVRDYTARAVVEGNALSPGEEYFYRFSTRAGSSPVGRFRTARPPDSRETLRIGFFSCQDFQAGYYTAHAGLAREDLDLVVCLGDYVYERGFFHGPPERRDTTGNNGDADVQTLREYRRKYALYRTDENLQAMHQASAFAGVWDDHEVEDNWSGELPGNATPAAQRRTSFAERRRVAMLAFFEWMPRFRMPSDRMRIYGSLGLGANAELLLLDTRQYRDNQPCNDSFLLPPCAEGETRDATLLGAAQKAWLKRRLQESPALWKIVANQVMIMALDAIPGVPSALNPDSWDGYGRERRELLEHVRRTATQDVTFITGDIHTFFAGDVRTNGRITGRPVATEFVGGSITSPGFEQFVDLPDVTEPAIRALNPHLRFADLRSRGYGVLEVTPGKLTANYRSPASIASPTSSMRTIARFEVSAGDPRVRRV